MSKFFIIFMLLIGSCELMAIDKKEVTRNLVKDARIYAKKVGQKKAIAEFQKTDGKFIQGEFYIFAVDMKGLMLAHPISKRLEGKNLYNLRDLNRKYFIREFIQVADDGEGWVSYYWKHPVKKRVMKKNSYIMRVNKNYFIGSGYYKQKKSQ